LTDPRYVAAIQSLVEGRDLDAEKVDTLAEIEQALPPRRIIPTEYCTLDRLTLLVSQACNARCVYCYADGGTYGSKPSLMTLTTAQNTVRFFLQQYSEIKQIQFFGGEPLLNAATMKGVAEFVSDLCDNGHIADRPRFTVVTNLTLFPPELPVLLDKFQLQLIVSVDGPAVIHDQLRPLASGGGSFERMYEGIRRVQQMTAGEQPVAAEVTYTAKHMQLGISLLDVYNFVQESLGISRVILVAVQTDDPTLKVTDGAWYVSIQQIIKSGYQAFNEGNLAGTHKWLSPWLRGVNPENAEPWECDLFCSAGTFSFAVDTQGDIYPCQMFVGHPQFRMGNIMSSPDVFASDTFRRVQQEIKPLMYKGHSECLLCPIRVICRECPAPWILANPAPASPVGSLCARKRELKIGLVALSLRMQEEHPDWWHQLANPEAPIATC